MKRRVFLTSTLLSAITLTACQPRRPLAPYRYSKVQLHRDLEQLRLAFEAKGRQVSNDLLPAIDAAELQQRCAWFPGHLPAEVIDLYAWRGGQKANTWDVNAPFWFRDCGFSSPEVAAQSYADILSTYGEEDPDGRWLETAFPIAEFNGGWLVLPTTPEGYGGFFRPVISIHMGYSIWFYSINQMLATCLEWVRHPSYGADGLESEDIELEIWRRHNPGLFEHQ